MRVWAARRCGITKSTFPVREGIAHTHLKRSKGAMKFTPLHTQGRSAQRSAHAPEDRYGTSRGVPHTASSWENTSYQEASAHAGAPGARGWDTARAGGYAGAGRAGDSARSGYGARRASGSARTARAGRAERAAATSRGNAAPAGDRAAVSYRRAGRGAAGGGASFERAASGADRDHAGRASANSSLIRYATDNVVVRAVYTLTTGPLRFAFFGVVALIVGCSLYFPLRGWYVAERGREVQGEQYQVQLASNTTDQEQVDKLLSQEGIRDIARSKLGLVEPGEISGMVTGLGESGDADAGSADGTGADEQGSAGDADAASDEPWYEYVLDRLFFFSVDDVQGITFATS